MSEARTITNDDWSGLLDDDEKILWQGKPYEGFLFNGQGLAPAWFGWFFFLFSIFWMVGAWTQTSGQGMTGVFFTLFGVPFVVIGFYMAIGQYFDNVLQRRKTWYALTNRRAIISTKKFRNKSLTSYPITKSTVIEYEQSVHDSIWFGTKINRDEEGGSTTTRIGFFGIKDARHVLSLMRQIQTDDK